MHVAWVVLLFAQVSTSSASDEPFLDDLPLTQEELELLESLRATSTAAEPQRPKPGLDPELLVPARRFRTRIGRSLGESLREEATAFSTSRGFVSGESPLWGGRGGQRIRLSLDGIELQHALDSIDRSTTLGLIDPWVVEEVGFRPRAPMSRGGFAGHGDVALTARAPRPGPHLGTELRALGRLADRSSGFRAAASAGLERAGLTVAGGYSDHDPMRDGAGRSLPGTGDEEASLLSRARLFDEAQDPIQVDLGFDVFRVTNARRFDLERRIDRLRSMISGFGRLRGHAGAAKLELLAGARRFDTRTEPAAGGALTEEAADVLQLEGTARYAVSEGLSVSIFGAGYTSAAYGVVLRGRMLRASGGVEAELSQGWFLSRLALRSGYAQSRLEGQVGPSEVFVLPELRLGLLPTESLSLFVGYTEAVHLPTVRDLSTATGPVELEHTRTIDLEARYQHRWLGLRLAGSTSFVANPLGFEAEVLVQRADAAVLGGEFEASVWPFEGFEAVFHFSLTRALGAARLDFIEGGTGALRLRHELGVRGAYVEAAARHSFPLRSADAALPDPRRRRAWPMPLLSVGGGLELGLGFALDLRIANALDVQERELDGDIPRPGIDLRLALEHRFEL